MTSYIRSYHFVYSNTTYVSRGVSMADAFKNLLAEYPVLRTSQLISAEVL